MWMWPYIYRGRVGGNPVVQDGQLCFACQFGIYSTNVKTRVFCKSIDYRATPTNSISFIIVRNRDFDGKIPSNTVYLSDYPNIVTPFRISCQSKIYNENDISECTQDIENLLETENIQKAIFVQKALQMIIQQKALQIIIQIVIFRKTLGDALAPLPHLTCSHVM